jgi:hypothetical protein
MRQRVDFDLDYLRNWTLWLDVRENPPVSRFAPNSGALSYGARSLSARIGYCDAPDRLSL